MIEALAELAVRLGANVQPGQVVAVRGSTGHEEMVRAIAVAAYRAGARFVDARYWDPWVKRARLEHAADDTLDYVPPWYGESMLRLADEGGASIGIVGTVAPRVLDGIDPARAGRDQLPFVKEGMQVVAERRMNWTAVPFPTPGWAEEVFPGLPADAALERLRHELAHVLRLDQPDPVAAWRERLTMLDAVATRLTSCRLDALRFEGPGTDLTVGLLPTSTWVSAGGFTTVDGIPHVPNLPTEEVFSAPDPSRVEGIVRATRPLNLQGVLVEDFTVRFEAGRAVEITAARGAEALIARTAMDEGAARLGEVALVDAESRIGMLGTVFGETLLDENASSHLAFGAAYPFCVEEPDRARVNASAIHVDFMVGGPDVDVTGVTAAGERVPVLCGGEWQV
jgi:aminopeptidase